MHIDDIARTISEDVNSPRLLSEEAVNPEKEWYEYDYSGPGWDNVARPLVDCLRRMKKARDRHLGDGPDKILIIQGSDRNKNTCPQEDPKSLDLAKMAVTKAEELGAEAKLLDLSRVTSEADKRIWPCKGCYSTSPALCHISCSCFPNESLNQAPDWMNEEIYELLVECHGLMIVCPVYWYGRPPILSAMLSRMVCFDSANPDPTTTLTDDKSSVKDIKKAKELERGPNEGGDNLWHYHLNKVLAGRRFSVFVHGDADGVTPVADGIINTLSWMGLVSSGPWANQSKYIGYMDTYSDSKTHIDDDDKASVESCVAGLIESVKQWRANDMPMPRFPDNEIMK